MVTNAAHAQFPVIPAPEVRQQGEQQERLQQEREGARRGLLQPGSQATIPSPPEPVRPWPDSESPCITIREITLVGDASESFPWVLDGLVSGTDPAVGRCLGSNGLNVAASRAQRDLIERGYVTSRIVFQEQDLASGRLALTLLPGRIGSIRFGQPDSRATALNAVPAHPGDVLNLRHLEQALENFKRIPTVEADIQIAPANTPDRSDLVITWRQAFPFRFNATLDDSGSKATGRYQGSTTLSYDHWWTLNDLFYVTLNHDLGGGSPGARGTRGHTVHYSVPWHHWLLAFTQSSNRYHQNVAGLSQDYVYSGRSENAEIKLSRLLHRNASQKTTVGLKAWLRRSSNFIDDTEVETQRRATGGWEVGLAHKAFFGRTTLDLNLAHKRGTAAFGAIPAPEEAFDEGTSRMRVTTLDVNLSAPFALGEQQLRYTGTVRVQRNGTSLTPQDRFAIGGRYTVRGFDGESSLSAERGWFLRNDLSWTLGDSGQEIYLGLDHGSVSGPSTQFLVGRHLTGAVIGLRGNVQPLTYDLFIGQPVSKPTYFRTHSAVAGFSVSASF
ncbi:ShlB/FhaC/HecB family hemolysin secretion/activation protein [Hydrogenophaga laconesensis]|uniref:Hemolysin activation/secretion protein n=1 Tax=Hydrogenophaga laconesensis TaxID=1805971 RepID=A0ABU1VIF4_9BURK|nr:ShlB/FhaC/HecB family hemolysin secretion/activation protein [Hydrogenophaga laconesensis]MDR7097263.1 hemolysin activation/secretion protein [Hydrogenophaga laconesensis]